MKSLRGFILMLEKRYRILIETIGVPKNPVLKLLVV